ncbi:MAG: PspA/IM30 family protein [Crocinitomicaceae bacterium]|nr:PspA/IM30 family protein [Flavobacteriales bacterium]NQZ36960.1 PspA/IM30 family protein [Crocinitomicaceae bacterium]PHR29581.1 MAG: phage shock protein A [Fluviicola sp.]
MNIFKRLFRIGEAEAHSALDKLENPIKMTEQGIRELKESLGNGIKALAEVKAMTIRSRNDHESYTHKAEEYERKAMLLLKKGQSGDMDSGESDRLASEALLKKQENVKHASDALEDKNKFESSVSKLEGNIKGLRSKISHYENELRTLTARVKVATATKNINRQMSALDTGGTVSMLERMKEKVAQEEALAESYGEIAGESRSLDEEIENAIGGESRISANEELEKMKERLGIKSDSSSTNS